MSLEIEKVKYIAPFPVADELIDLRFEKASKKAS
jgi:hypothetical protein